MAGVTLPYRYFYEHVPSSTTSVLGGTGATGDYLHRIICTVNTALTSQVHIRDGGAFTLTILPNNVAVGVYTIDIEASSKQGAWSVITGAGVEVIGIGVFSA